FRDFVALADLLKVRFRGLFLPPRPDKNVVEGQRMANGFVEERRAALERYL
ncbi:PX domain-containing protein, partial [Haematococcus lacustris]